jgi:serine/threonine protein kinase/tetratricopeptide (TPR) repeat protein
VEAETFDLETTPSLESPGSVIGPYRLMEQIGEGGFGLVFVAEQQQPVRRRVALKIIKPGMDTRDVIARFAAERQALALMDHPHIAKVLDAGTTPTGRPFFVMELVRGKPITEFCDQSRLSPRQRLELFVDVCHAVQHAHQKGIIHRDVKPSNVLVTSHDGRPVVKVIDFGVAKAIGQQLTERTIYTRFAQMVGTPLYMSPEQAEMSGLDIDTRTDIYSLGVVLYELLTGTTPVDKKRLSQASHDEVRRIIREEDPPRPSTRLSQSAESLPTIAAARGIEPGKLSRLLRGDLDWIVMKTLEKDRSRRYETASALARDIQRFLADEPVEARPPSTAYRLQKLARRHRALLATSGLVLLVLVAGIVASTAQAVRATRAEQIARNERDLAGQARDVAAAARTHADAQRELAEKERVRAEEQQQLAEAALVAETRARRRTREALDTFTDDFLKQLLGTKAQLGDNEKAFLRKVESLYAELAADHVDSEESRSAAAEGHRRVARVRLFLGELKQAEAGFRQSNELYAALVVDFPATTDYREKLARSRRGLVETLRTDGQKSEAVEEAERAVAECEQLDTEFPQQLRYRALLGDSLISLGAVMQELGRPHDDVERVFRRALAIVHELDSAEPKDPTHRRSLAMIYNNLGNLFIAQSDWQVATANLGRAIRIHNELQKESPTDHHNRHALAVSYRNLAHAWSRMGKTSESKAALDMAAYIESRLADEFPSVPAYRRTIPKSGSTVPVANSTPPAPVPSPAVAAPAPPPQGLRRPFAPQPGVSPAPAPVPSGSPAPAPAPVPVPPKSN